MATSSLARRIGSLAAVAALLVVVGSAPAAAQADRYETCAAYGTVVGTGGPLAVTAALRLQAIGAPNPPGIDVALEVLIDAEDNAGTTPEAAAVAEAYDTLTGYYGPVCDGLDVCPLVNQAVATNDGSSAEAARTLRGITAPAPPGIGAALAVIAGDVTPAATGFYDSVAEAQEAVATYFPCNQLAFTGSTTAPLAVLGGALIAAGMLTSAVSRCVAGSSIGG